MDEPSNTSILYAPNNTLLPCDDWLTGISLKMTMQQIFTGILTVFFGGRVLPLGIKASRPTEL